MSERALELLALPENEALYLLDIGCGSGLSGSVLEENGHMWVGIDISPAMLGMILCQQARRRAEMNSTYLFTLTCVSS